MSGITFGGLGNGFDFQSVITALVAAKQVPIDQLSSDQQARQSQLTDYQSLGANLLKLQSAAAALKTSGNFNRFSAASSDTNVFSVSAAGGATPGNYAVNVTQLAAAHQFTNKATKAVASTSTSIVSGASATFSFKVGTGTVHDITLGTGATLEDLQTQINDLGAGVQASLLNTGTESNPAYRLVLSSTTTGLANAVTVTGDSTDLDFLNTSGTGGTDTLQAAQDATVVLGNPTANPVTIQRSTNTIVDAVPGLTLTLKSTTQVGTTDSVSVNFDIPAIKSNIKSVVSAYNDIVKFINDRNTYDTDKKQGGVFFAESTPKTIQSRLRRALADDVGGLTGLTSVSETGFKTERDGSITIDDTALDVALSTNYTGVRNLFIGQAASTGVAQRLSDAIDGLDAVDTGALTLRENNLTTQIGDLSNRITQGKNSLSQYQEQLQLQYAQLDGLLRQFQSQTNYLTQSQTQKQS